MKMFSPLKHVTRSCRGVHCATGFSRKGEWLFYKIREYTYTSLVPDEVLEACVLLTFITM